MESGLTGISCRGAVLHESGCAIPYAESLPLKVSELRLDPSGPGELLLRVRAAGVCHSDLSVINGSRPRPLPMLLGHEAAGEVVEVGSPGSRFSPGDRVVLSFVPSCGSCVFCASGRPGLCEEAAASNVAGTLPGGHRRIHSDEGNSPLHHLGVSAFADHAVVSERSAVKIDDDIPFDIAALFGCAVLTGVGAILYSAQVRPGDSVAIFGLGGVGMAALLGAVVAGAGEIVAVDPVAEKREFALSLGATAVVSGEDAAEEIRRVVPGGVDKAVETVGSAAVLAEAFAATGRGGTTVTVGLPDPSEMLSIPATLLTGEEKTIRGSYLGSCVPRRDIPRFLRLYRDGRLPVDRLLTHHVELDEINKAMDRLAAGEAIRQVVVL